MDMPGSCRSDCDSLGRGCGREKWPRHYFIGPVAEEETSGVSGSVDQRGQRHPGGWKPRKEVSHGVLSF